MTAEAPETAPGNQPDTPPKRPLFRPEAVEYHAQARVGGRTIDLREGRVTWLFRGLLLALAAAAGLAFVVRAETYAKGAVVAGGDGRQAVVFINDAERLSDAGQVTVTVDGVELPAHVVRVTGPASLVVELDRPVAPRARGTATISLGSKPVAVLLLGWDR